MKSRIFSIILKGTAILLILAVAYIGIGYLLLSARRDSVASGPIGNIRVITGAQTAFYELEGGYAGSWKQLRDDPIADGKKAYLYIDFAATNDGYRYTLKPAGNSLSGKNGTTVYTDFICIAEPIDYGQYDRSFYVDCSNILRFEVGKAASKDSDPI